MGCALCETVQNFHFLDQTPRSALGGRWGQSGPERPGDLPGLRDPAGLPGPADPGDPAGRSGRFPEADREASADTAGTSHISNPGYIHFPNDNYYSDNSS